LFCFLVQILLWFWDFSLHVGKIPKYLTMTHNLNNIGSLTSPTSHIIIPALAIMSVTLCFRDWYLGQSLYLLFSPYLQCYSLTSYQISLLLCNHVSTHLTSPNRPFFIISPQYSSDSTTSSCLIIII
jgi:hypothetical protein